MRTYSNSGGGLVTPQWRGLWRQRRIGCSHLSGIDAASSHTCIAALLVWQEALIGRQKHSRTPYHARPACQQQVSAVLSSVGGGKIEMSLKRANESEHVDTKLRND